MADRKFATAVHNALDDAETVGVEIEKLEFEYSFIRNRKR